MGDNIDEERGKAYSSYAFLAIWELILGIVLIILGAIGESAFVNSGKGAPYYIGSYVVAAFILLGFLFAGIIALMKASKNVHANQVGCVMVAHQVVSSFTLLGCFVGLIFVGVFGVDCKKSSTDGFGDSCSFAGNFDKNRNVAVASLFFILLAVITAVFSIVLFCMHGNKFGISAPKRQFGAVQVHVHDTGPRREDMVDELRRNNELLQKQVRLQEEQLRRQQTQSQPYPSSYFTPDSYPPPGQPGPSRAQDPAYPPPPPYTPFGNK